MTRPALIPMPAAQMALARARQTVRAPDATPADLDQACRDLETHGDWLDRDTARKLRAVVADLQTVDRRIDAMPTARATLALFAVAAAVILALALLAHWQITERAAATVAQAERFGT